mmetsp:Transcript_27062/g.49842  ORF Transcript_27062/g.49842 Transcript_27062/m.49842 type:complete len:254 (-) Transcript_27062:425-1186(-)
MKPCPLPKHVLSPCLTDTLLPLPSKATLSSPTAMLTTHLPSGPPPPLRPPPSRAIRSLLRKKIIVRIIIRIIIRIVTPPLPLPLVPPSQPPSPFPFSPSATNWVSCLSTAAALLFLSVHWITTLLLLPLLPLLLPPFPLPRPRRLRLLLLLLLLLRPPPPSSPLSLSSPSASAPSLSLLPNQPAFSWPRPLQAPLPRAPSPAPPPSTHQSALPIASFLYPSRRSLVVFWPTSSRLWRLTFRPLLWTRLALPCP